MIDVVAATAAESERFATAAADVGSLADSAMAMVPSCPDWSADDLVWHLTQVQHFWASIVADGLDDPADAPQLDRPRGPDLIATFVATSPRLVDFLEGADPAAPCWSWYEPDQRVGWVQRRQAHEALIHRVDAELARAAVGGAGVGPIDPALAADGIDEMLRIMLGVDPLAPWAAWVPEGPTVRLVAATDGAPDRTWLVGIGLLTGTDPSGQDHADPALRVAAVDNGESVTATVHGQAAELDRWLWRRGALDTATVEVLVCEEDCAFSVGVLAMADKPRGKVIGTVQKYFSAMSDEYLEGRVKEYYPDVWERVTGETVTAAESGTVRRREWYAAHADDHVGVSAVGSWADGVPAGKVKVTTQIGGHGADYRNNGAEAEWLVDADRYDQRHPEGYVVDPAVDQQVTARAA